MEKRVQVGLLLILVLGAVFASAAGAQREQWLQYRSMNEARQVIPDIGYQYRPTTAARPQGIKLPEFRGGQQLFLEWKTPMAASGRIWLAFDQSTGKGQYDRLYVDANANDDLTDDAACAQCRRDSILSCFGPVKVVFASPDGPITYHLGAERRTFSGQSMCLLSPACWYEGRITVGGVKKPCLLLDHNINGAFNDQSPDFSKSDRIRIGAQGDAEAGAVGRYVEVEGRLYGLEIARDGAFVKLAPAPDVPYASARLADNISTIIVVGENGSFVRTPEEGTIKLPVGAYQTISWVVARQDDAGAKWEMRGLPDGPPRRRCRQDQIRLGRGPFAASDPDGQESYRRGRSLRPGRA